MNSRSSNPKYSVTEVTCLDPISAHAGPISFSALRRLSRKLRMVAAELSSTSERKDELWARLQR